MLYTKYISSGPHGFREEDFFFMFSHYKSKGVHDLLGRGRFGSQGLHWQDLSRGPLNIATYKIYKLWASWFQRRGFLSFSHYKALGDNDPRCVASLGPRGLIGRIYVGDHLTLLHTYYISSGPHGFREEDILSFSHYKSMGDNDPWDVANLDSRGMVGRINVGDHLKSVHT